MIYLILKRSIQNSNFILLVLIGNLYSERYITREKCIERCGNSWLAPIDDSTYIKKKNYTGRFFDKKFPETGLFFKNSTFRAVTLWQSQRCCCTEILKSEKIMLNKNQRTSHLSRYGRFQFWWWRMVWTNYVRKFTSQKPEFTI